MYTKEDPLEVEPGINFSGGMLFNGNQSEEYFKRMVEIKDKNIQDLLKELRQTKQIYTQYKNQYLNEEKRMKAKITEMSVKLQTQLGEMEKYKHLNTKLKADLEANIEREKKQAQVYEKKIAEMKNSLLQIQNHNKQLKYQRISILDKQKTLEEKCSKLQERLKHKSEEVKIYEQQTKRLRDELLRRVEEWKVQKQILIQKGVEEQRRKVAKNRANTRLDAIENKIKTNLMKI